MCFLLQKIVSVIKLKIENIGDKKIKGTLHHKIKYKEGSLVQEKFDLEPGESANTKHLGDPSQFTAGATWQVGSKTYTTPMHRIKPSVFQIKNEGKYELERVGEEPMKYQKAKLISGDEMVETPTTKKVTLRQAQDETKKRKKDKPKKTKARPAKDKKTTKTKKTKAEPKTKKAAKTKKAKPKKKKAEDTKTKAKKGKKAKTKKSKKSKKTKTAKKTKKTKDKKAATKK